MEKGTCIYVRSAAITVREIPMQFTVYVHVHDCTFLQNYIINPKEKRLHIEVKELNSSELIYSSHLNFSIHLWGRFIILI